MNNMPNNIRNMWEEAARPHHAAAMAPRPPRSPEDQARHDEGLARAMVAPTRDEAKLADDAAAARGKPTRESIASSLALARKQGAEADARKDKLIKDSAAAHAAEVAKRLANGTYES